MSGHLNQYFIRELLCIVYGESPELRYLMRKENRLKQLVIARELFINSDTFIPTPDRQRATLFTAIFACIQEKLAEYSDRDIEIAKYVLQDAGINPTDLPDFITNLFSLKE